MTIGRDDRLTKLADVVIGTRLWHGSDGEEGTRVAPQGFTQDVLPEIGAGGPQSLQFRKVHLNTQRANDRFEHGNCNVQHCESE